MKDYTNTNNILDELEESIEWKNIQFARKVIDAARLHIRQGIDPDKYAMEVLDNLWCEDIDTYADSNGDERYHEIGSIYTKDRKPIVISHP